MKEWNDFYNSFNSAKGLAYYNNYLEIDKWRLGLRKSPPPPIEISLDLFASCQLNCSHCNFSKYFEEDIGNRRISDEHLVNLIKFFGRWKEDEYFKVRGICFGGGGESTLHTKMGEALLLSQSLGMRNSIATNGINFDDKLIDIATATCRWIGISVDSATSNTYKIGRKGDYFDIVTKNIKKLSKKSQNGSCLIGFKFLVFSYNQHEIYDACQLAKDLGVKEFHCRPASWNHQGMQSKSNDTTYDRNLILEQFEECRKLEDKDFKVYLILHKYNSDFTPYKKFTQCYASPIGLQVNPTGNCYLCPDTRELDFYKLGEHYPNPDNILNFWGSPQHYDLVFKQGCSKCNWRCTFNHYNEQCERLAINKDDPMCLDFV